MESGIISLHHCCIEWCVTMDVEKVISEAVVLLIGDNKMNVSTHNNNDGALVLAENLPPQFNT